MSEINEVNLIPVATQLPAGHLAVKIGNLVHPIGITATGKITVNGVAPDNENNINFPQYNYIEDGNINVSLSTEVGKSTVNVYSTPLKSLEITHNADLDYDFTIIFSTRDDFQGFSLYLTKDCYVNKELVIEENKRYIICFDKDSILWTELTQYEQ